jgi:hypothetical protein
MTPFLSLRKYEQFVYTLDQRFPSIKGSTLTVVRRGKRMAILQGELDFGQGFRIVLKERLSFDEGPVVIEDYGYELWHYDEEIAWYDAQPHPHNGSLASTHPHHKHIMPDIKHHRIPAPEMSFVQPNIPALIKEVETLLNAETRGQEREV